MRIFKETSERRDIKTLDFAGYCTMNAVLERPSGSCFHALLVKWARMKASSCRSGAASAFEAVDADTDSANGAVSGAAGADEDQTVVFVGLASSCGVAAAGPAVAAVAVVPSHRRPCRIP